MAAHSTLEPSTYSAIDTQQLGRLSEALTPDEARDPVPRCYLVGPRSEEPIELPEEIYHVLCRTVEAMQKGLSVTISPTSQTLTTQQAADLLGISRPTLIKILDEGTLPFTRAGTHRRLALVDVREYRDRRRQEQYAAIDALSVDVDESTDIGDVLDELRSARKVVAERRRKR